MADANIIEIENTLSRDSALFWCEELKQSQKMLKDWHKRASKIVDRYLGDTSDDDQTFRLNLFHRNIKTVSDMLYSQLPKVETSRTNTDANDDVARVASEMAERLINLDIAANGKELDSVLRSCLQDRLLPGLGVARVRYTYRQEEVITPAYVDEFGMEVPESVEMVTVDEDAPIDYYHWQDVLWGWGRSFADLPWIAFRSYLSRDKVAERFGDNAAKQVTYRKQKMVDTKDPDMERDEDTAPWQKAEIWEIWDKVEKRVLWFNEGAKLLLEKKDDPLQVKGFFPCPPFLIANATTSLYRPTPDFLLAQDLYNEIDELQTRISIIKDAVKVVGVYDSQAEGIQRMLSEGVDNDLIPVDEWAMFAEKGGIKGQIDWLPIGEVVDALGKLRELRDEDIRLLQMVTGMADVMQGSLNSPYEGVKQSQLKAQYGSVPLQSLQDQFAAFATDLMQLKLEVIARHFDTETIIKRSNMQTSFDAELIPQAVELLQSPDDYPIRIVVRPESVAMIDYARLKSERTEFLTALATFMQSAAPLIEQDPNTMPYLMKFLQWTLAGFKGSQEIEGVLDRAIQASIQQLQKQSQEQQPDPEQQRAQMEIQKIREKAQADSQLRQQDSQADILQVQAQHQAKMGEIKAQHMARMAETRAKLIADLQKERVTVYGDIAQTQAQTEGEIEKRAAESVLERQDALAKALIELDQYAEEQRMDMEALEEETTQRIREAAQTRTDETDSDEE